jgi:hypothetical protein
MDSKGARDDPRWSPIAAGVFSPAAAVRGERRISLFVRGPRGELLHREREGQAWSEFQSLGTPMAGVEGSRTLVPVDWPIAACGTGANEIQLLARGPEGELLHGTLRGSQWTGFACVGAPAAQSYDPPVPMGFASAPTACSRASGQMDVFVVGASGGLLHSCWSAAGFTEFESLGGVASPRAGDPESPLAGPVSACNCGNRRMGIFGRGASGHLLLKWWSGASWSPFASLGAPEERDPTYPAVLRPVPLSGPPAACGGGSTRLDVFARGPAGDLLHRVWDGKGWSAFESLGWAHGPAGGAPVSFTGSSLACVWDRYRLDVFARAADGRLYNAYWDGSWDHPG